MTNGSPSEKMDAGESNKQMEQYRHSSTVQALGHLLGVPVEQAAMLFEDFNSGVLILAIAYGLFKFLPGAFKARREKIVRDLADARSATELANERLKAVEARLAKLDSEIEAIRQHAAHDSEGDQKRIEASLEEERARIIRSAEQEIASAQAAAQRELKRFAASLAVDRAISRVELSAADDRLLIEEFTASLGSKLHSGDFSKRGQN
jgi:F-type H+-transporting ATPase subunit b